MWLGLAAPSKTAGDENEMGEEELVEHELTDASRSLVEVNFPGVRRDRTEFFRGWRLGGLPPQLKRQEASAERSTFVSELRSIHALASHAHTSIAAKLAQHKGLLQIGVSMPERVMPLEMRVCARTIEVEIDTAIANLDPLLARLSRLQGDELVESPKDAYICGTLREYIATTVRDPMCTIFEEQRAHLADLHAMSPLTSPKISSVLHERLLAVVCSPPCSARRVSTRAPSSASSCSVPTPLPSPLASPRLRAARDPAVSDERQSEAGTGRKEDSECSFHAAPFSRLMGRRESSFEIVELALPQASA